VTRIEKRQSTIQSNHADDYSIGLACAKEKANHELASILKSNMQNLKVTVSEGEKNETLKIKPQLCLNPLCSLHKNFKMGKF